MAPTVDLLQYKKIQIYNEEASFWMFLHSQSVFDPIWGVMSCILKWKGKDFPSTTDICTDKGVVVIKSTTLGSHMWRKAVKHALGKQ